MSSHSDLLNRDVDKLCECGCGHPTQPAKQTDRRYGTVKGQPCRYLPGHSGGRIRPPAEVGPEVRRCRNCPYPLAPSRGHVPEGWRRHAGRGLCQPCWEKARKRGELVDHERVTRSYSEVMDEWEHMRAAGETPERAAERLGMSYTAFAQAYYRCRRAGDPRALPALRKETA